MLARVCDLMLQNVEVQGEQLQETSGKFDELNSILSVTQQRLNKLKVVGGKLCCER